MIYKSFKILKLHFQVSNSIISISKFVYMSTIYGKQKQQVVVIVIRI